MGWKRYHPALPAVRRFFHGGITVSDMAKALSFYRDGLGLELEYDRIADAPYLRTVLGLEFKHIRVVYLKVPGGGFVELLEYAGIETVPAASRPCDPGSGHLCLYVDDVESMYRRMRQLGFPARSSGVVDIISGPNQGARSVYILDQDGYAVELFQKRPGG